MSFLPYSFFFFLSGVLNQSTDLSTAGASNIYILTWPSRAQTRDPIPPPISSGSLSWSNGWAGRHSSVRHRHWQCGNGYFSAGCIPILSARHQTSLGRFRTARTEQWLAWISVTPNQCRAIQATIDNSTHRARARESIQARGQRLCGQKIEA